MRGVIFVLIFSFLSAYQAQVKPFDTYNVTSSVAGKILEVKKDKEATFYKGVLVKIDDKQDLIDLKNLNFQIKLTKEEIKNQEEVVKKKKAIYEKYMRLKTKSQEAKNLKFYDYINAKNQLISLKSKLSDLIAKKDKLKDVIDKKNIKVEGYVESIKVKKGEYVSPGKLIAIVDDLSKEKLTIYVPIDRMENIKNSRVYINGKKSNFKIYKIWKTPDSKFITSYKVELIGSGLKVGEIVRVELRN